MLSAGGVRCLAYNAAGRKYGHVIHDSILRTRVAILFVSRQFLDSYVAGTELPLLRRQSDAGCVRIVWMSVGGSQPPSG